MAEQAAKATREFPIFLDYTEDIYEALASEFSDELAKVLTIAGKQEREAETNRVKALAKERLGVRFEDREKEISAAFRSLTKKLVRERIIRDGVRIDGRGLPTSGSSPPSRTRCPGCTAPRCSSAVRPRCSASRP